MARQPAVDPTVRESGVTHDDSNARAGRSSPARASNRASDGALPAASAAADDDEWQEF